MMVTIPSTGQGTGDMVVNTWHFRTADLTDATLDFITGQVAGFYTAIKQNYPSGILFSQATAKWYNLADPKPRPPIRETLLGTTGTGVGTSAPSEIAVCVSYYAVRTPGLDPKRSRGRIYVGPFAMTSVGGPQVGAQVISDLIGAAGTLLTTSNGATWKWVVWSQAQADDPQGTTFPDQTVIGGWVDNAWDTQRRRGLDPTSRTTFGAPSAQVLPAS